MSYATGGEPQISVDGPLLVATRSATAARAARSHGGGPGSIALFHGELHDREALRSAVVAEVRRPSDADLYRLAFGKYGRACDERLYGRYAAIVWDAHTRRMHCAASAIEAQPLFWGRSGTRLVVSSTPLAHIALGFARQMNAAKLDASLSGSKETLHQSWFAGINRVPPGYSIELSEHDEHRREYWSMGAIQPRSRISDEQALEQTEALLEAGFANVLEGRTQPAIALSGGLDSQIVAAHLAARSSQEIPAYCSVPEAGYSETPRRKFFGNEGLYADALGDMHPSLQVRKIDAEGANFTDDLGWIFQLGNIPPRNVLNMPWLNAIMARARMDGADVLVTGGNGNMTFSHDGLDGFAHWARSGQIRKVVHEALAMEDARAGWRRILAFAVKPLLPRAALHLVAAKRALGANVDTQLSLSERAGVPTRKDRLQFADLAMSEGSEIDAALELRHGIALRDPTTYRPFVEFCLSLPPEQFLRDGETRFLARRLGKDKIPEQVRREDRTGLQAADWPIRLGRQRADLLAELRMIDQDDRLATRLDTPRLIADLEDWDGLDRTGTGVIDTIAGAIPQAIVLSRFVRYVEGTSTR